MLPISDRREFLGPALIRRFFAFVFSIWACAASADLSLVSPNAQSFGFFGVVAGVEDITGDDRGDLAVGTLGEGLGMGLDGAGRVYFFNGVTGALVDTLTSPDAQAGGAFGARLERISDVNGDDVPDLLVAAPGETDSLTFKGRVYIIDPTTRLEIRNVEAPGFASESFGVGLAGLEDVTGDSVPDLVIGERENGFGAAFICNGATGAILFPLASPAGEPLGQFGWSVGQIPDLSGDGLPDVAVGASQEDPTVLPVGRVHVFNGATGDFIRTLQTPNTGAGVNFGFEVAGLEDISGNGRGEVIVGAPNQAAVYIFEGATGDLIQTILPIPGQPAGFFGSAVEVLEDLTEDGEPEILIGAATDRATGNPTGSGRVYMFEIVSAEHLLSFDSPTPQMNGGFGALLSLIPDASGDGVPDFAVAALAEGGSFAGRAYTFTAPTDFDPRSERLLGAMAGAGGTAGISPEALQTADPDNQPTELTYTVTSAPTKGQLALDGGPTNVSSFTQEDIDDGDLLYVSSGQPGADTFTFTVEDGDGNDLGPLTFPINIVDPLQTPEFAYVTANGGRITEIEIVTGNRRQVVGDVTTFGPLVSGIDLIVEDDETIVHGLLYASSTLYYRVDIATGQRDLEWQAGDGLGPVPDFGTALARADDGTIYALEGDGDGGILRINPTTGVRTPVTDELLAGTDLDLLADGDLVYSDIYSLLRVDPVTGDQSVLTGLGVGSGPTLIEPFGIAVGPQGELWISAYADVGEALIMSVDPDTGDRVIVSDSVIGAGPAISTFSEIESISGGFILACDIIREAVICIDTVTGNRVVVSSSPTALNIGTGPELGDQYAPSWMAVPAPHINKAKRWRSYP